MPDCDCIPINNSNVLNGLHIMTEQQKKAVEEAAEKVYYNTAMGLPHFISGATNVLDNPSKYGLQPINEWISVKDRLPDFGKQVLVYCRIYGRYIGSYEEIGDFYGNKFGNWHDGKVLGVLPPIYWQPLPQPPINEREEG